MVTSPGDGIRDILSAVPGFVADGWVVIVGVLPPEPDKVIAIRHSPGRGGEPSIAMDYPAVQLIARGPAGQGGYNETYQKLWAARQALVGIPSAPIAWPELTSCTLRGNILDLDYDENNRPMLAQNLNLIVSYVTDGYRD